VPTRKEILEGLLSESQELRLSVGDNTEAAHGLRDELDRLQSDIADASHEIAATTERSLSLLSDRLDDLRSQLADAFAEGGRKIGREIIKGNVAGQIVGQVIANRLQERAHENEENPRERMARRITGAITIILESINAGAQNDYDATLRLLRVHEFGAEQARYILDLLYEKYGILVEVEKDGIKYLDVDRDSDAFNEMMDHYNSGRHVYLA